MQTLALTVADLRARWHLGRTGAYDLVASDDWRAAVRTLRTEGGLRFDAADVLAWEEAHYVAPGSAQLSGDLADVYLTMAELQARWHRGTKLYHLVAGRQWQASVRTLRVSVRSLFRLADVVAWEEHHYVVPPAMDLVPPARKRNRARRAA